MSEIQAATDEQIAAWEQERQPLSSPALALIARIRQEQARADRLTLDLADATLTIEKVSNVFDKMKARSEAAEAEVARQSARIKALVIETHDYYQELVPLRAEVARLRKMLSEAVPVINAYGGMVDEVATLRAEVERLNACLRMVKVKWEWFWGWVDSYVTHEDHCDAAQAVDDALRDALIPDTTPNTAEAESEE